MNLKASLSLFAALLGASCIAASAAKQAPAIAAFDRAYTGITDYTCILHVRETKGTQTQDRVYQYSFMNPHYVKTLILDGDGKGSGGVWIGGDQVSGHLGGILSGIHLKINLHDPRAVSLRGVTIPDGLLPRIIDDYGSSPESLRRPTAVKSEESKQTVWSSMSPIRRRTTTSPSRSCISRRRRIGRSGRSCTRDRRSCSTNRSAT